MALTRQQLQNYFLNYPDLLGNVRDALQAGYIEDVNQDGNVDWLDFAQQHWDQYGPSEFRTYGDIYNLSPAEALAYINRYPDLLAAWEEAGRPNPQAWANQHYSLYGAGEGRDYSVLDAATPGMGEPPAQMPGFPGGVYTPYNPDTGLGTLMGGGQGLPGLPTGSAQIPYAGYSGLNSDTIARYLRDNPDVMDAYAQYSDTMTPEEFVAAHYNTYGLDEGRQSPYQTNATYPQIPTSNGVPDRSTYRALHNNWQTVQSISPTSAQLASVYGYGTGPMYAPQMPFYAPFSGINYVDPQAASQYFSMYPDVVDAYNSPDNPYSYLPPDQFAALHYNTFGAQEGRASPFGANTVFATNYNPMLRVTPTYGERGPGSRPESVEALAQAIADGEYEYDNVAGEAGSGWGYGDAGTASEGLAADEGYAEAADGTGGMVG